MAIDSSFPNPYLPSTDAEAEALAKFTAASSAGRGSGLRFALREGILANPASGGSIEDTEFEFHWNRFVTVDLELPRSYPTSADAFIAGYRASISEPAFG